MALSLNISTAIYSLPIIFSTINSSYTNTSYYRYLAKVVDISENYYVLHAAPAKTEYYISRLYPNIKCGDFVEYQLYKAHLKENKKINYIVIIGHSHSRIPKVSSLDIGHIIGIPGLCYDYWGL